MSQILPNFIPLSEVEHRVDATVNLVGVVVDTRPPRMTAGSDWMITFKICDQTCPDEASSVPIRAFKPTMNQLPQIHSNGDVILIKSVKLQRYQGKIYGITSFTTTWIISYLPAIANTVPSTVTFPASVKPQPMEFAQLKGLRNWWTSIGGAISSDNTHIGSYQNMPASCSVPQTDNYQISPTNNHQVLAPKSNAYQIQIPGIKKGSLKFSLIRDMQVDNFYNLIGLVVKTFSAAQNFTLYITDYSMNSMVHSYEWPGNNTAEEDEEGNFSRAKRGDRKWPGPWGQYTLQITLWDEHAVTARQILQESVGVYVGLKNVRAKKNGDGNLEGVLHGGRVVGPGLYLIDDMRDQRVKDIIHREKAYTKRFNTNMSQHEQEQEAKIAELRKRKAKVEAERNERQKKGNQHIACEKQQSAIPTSLSEILGAPCINRNYHVFCRVVDYTPEKLEDFSKKIKVNNPNDDYEFPIDSWIWRFALLFRDKEGKEARVIVEGKDAEGFLGLDAVDLRNDERALLCLKERLFLVWGDLEERKSRKRLKEAQSLKRKRNNNDGPRKKRETDGLGKPVKRHSKEPSSDLDTTDSEDDSGSDDEEDSGQCGKMFLSCIREYTVNGKKLHKLFGTTIRYS
ncbi:hypothetical protein DFP73DRAFT_545869 [Morchella snyderi]|nr:hypothetical protein DFP73DRAFT_545869 [Morchella snyderi]